MAYDGTAELPLPAVPARFGQNFQIGLIQDGPIICAVLRLKLIGLARNVSDVDGPFRVDCLNHPAVF
jgi:hypothetical protein